MRAGFRSFFAAWPAVAGLMAVLTTARPSPAATDGLKVGAAMPDLGTFQLEGKLPATVKGRVVLLDFWASWCEPCKLSFPVMEELHQRHSPRGLVVIAVSVDERRADMEAFLRKQPAAFTLLRDAKQKLVEKVSVETMPSSFLIDRQGKVRFVHAGFRGDETKKKYEQEIESLLKEGPPE